MDSYNKIYKQISIAFQSNNKDEHHNWIQQLLQNYYDKMYDYQLDKKMSRCIYRGLWNDVEAFLFRILSMLQIIVFLVKMLTIETILPYE